MLCYIYHLLQSSDRWNHVNTDDYAMSTRTKMSNSHRLTREIRKCQWTYTIKMYFFKMLGQFSDSRAGRGILVPVIWMAKGSGFDIILTSSSQGHWTDLNIPRLCLSVQILYYVHVLLNYRGWKFSSLLFCLHLASRFKVQGSLLFVTYIIIQGIIGSEMLK